MATDARLSVGLAAHPKTKKLIRRIGGDGAWRLVCLFLWCAANRSDGNLAGMSDEDIELAVDWGGDDGAFVAALSSVGFLDGDEFSRSIHDWEEHNPWAAGSEARSEKARWAAMCKQHGRKVAAARMPEYARSVGAAPIDSPDCTDSLAHGKQDECMDSATSTPEGELDSATSTRIAESSSAPSPSPSPSPSLKEKTTSSGKPDHLPGFMAFWSAWPSTPRKVAKAKCAEKWRRERLEAQSDSILAHVQREKSGNQQWRNGYEPAPLTYLTQRRWEDDDAPRNAEWWQQAGFTSLYEAENAGCNQFIYRQFRDGQRVDGGVTA